MKAKALSFLVEPMLAHVRTRSGSSIGREGVVTMKVSDLMTKEVRACHQHDSLNQAAQLMWENDCGAVPVIDYDRKVIGC
jgi:CBS domain-containing protein